MWPKLYYRWMMLHKYILNLDSWKNTVCYEDWQLCLVISFSTKNSGRYQQNWNLQNTASLVDASLWHLKYFIVNILTGCRYRINCQEKQYRRAILWKLLCQFLNICGLIFDVRLSRNRQYLFYYGKLVWYLYWVLESCMEILTHTVFSGHLLSQSVCRCTSLHKK